MIVKIINEHNSFENSTQDYTGIPSAISIVILNHDKKAFFDFDIIFNEMNYTINKVKLSNCIFCDVFEKKAVLKYKEELINFFKDFNTKYNLKLNSIYFFNTKTKKDGSVVHTRFFRIFVL